MLNPLDLGIGVFLVWYLWGTIMDVASAAVLLAVVYLGLRVLLKPEFIQGTSGGGTPGPQTEFLLQLAQAARTSLFLNWTETNLFARLAALVSANTSISGQAAVPGPLPAAFVSSAVNAAFASAGASGGRFGCDDDVVNSSPSSFQQPPPPPAHQHHQLRTRRTTAAPMDSRTTTTGAGGHR